MSHQNEKKESNPGYQRQFEPGKMGFLWLFYGFSTSRSKKPPNLTLRLTSSCHPVLTKQLDVTLLKNKSDETRNNHVKSVFLEDEIQRQPVNTGRLHGYGFNAALLEPLDYRLQVLGKAPETTVAIRIPVIRYTYLHSGGRNVNPCCIWVDYLQFLTRCCFYSCSFLCHNCEY